MSSMKTLEDVQVGDTVVLPDARYAAVNHTKHEVTRVGRTLIGIQLFGREATFRKVDGRDSKHGSNSPGLPTVIYSEDQWADREYRTSLVERFVAVRIEGRHGSKLPDYPTEVLEQLLAILEPLNV